MSALSVISLCLLCLAVGFLIALVLVNESKSDIDRGFTKPKDDFDKKA